MKKMTRIQTGNDSAVKACFASLYEYQIRFQREVISNCHSDPTYPVPEEAIPALPFDDVGWYEYHVSAMVEELGELMKADKRWKTHRNVAYDPVNKLEELADVIITAMNMSIFSGFTAEDLYAAIGSKIQENFIKLHDSKNG